MVEVLASAAATAERVADVAASVIAEDAADAAALGVADAATFGVADSAAKVLASAAAMAEMAADVAPSVIAEDAADVDGVTRAAAARAGEDMGLSTTSTTGGINCPSSSVNPVYGFHIFRNRVCSFEPRASPCIFGFSRWHAMS